MLNENTILVTAPHGPYLAIGTYGNSKEEIAQTLNVFHNYAEFEGEVIFKSDKFGYITGPQQKPLKGLISYFSTLEIQQGGQWKIKGRRRARAIRAAQKVWAARKQENFMVDEANPVKYYAEPNFSSAA